MNSSGLQQPTVRGFYRQGTFWQGKPKPNSYQHVDEVIFGIFREDGFPVVELDCRWYMLDGSKTPSPCIRSYEDTWKMFFDLSDVFAKLAEATSQKISPERFCDALLMCGFQDFTAQTRAFVRKFAPLSEDGIDLETEGFSN